MGPMAGQPTQGFAGLLRQLRDKAGLTQEQLAEAATLSPRSISDLERVSPGHPAMKRRGCWLTRSG